MFILSCFLIAFSCAAMNHLGLIATLEKLLNHSLPILNCSRCSTFWLVLMHAMCCHCGLEDHRCTIMAIAIAFGMSFVAVWMELAMGGIDKIYNYLYDKIYPTASADNTPAAREEDSDNKNEDGSDDALSEVPS